MTTVFKQVGPYEILRQIGHGGMAVVFLAVDTRINQHVALKLVPGARRVTGAVSDTTARSGRSPTEDINRSSSSV